MAGKMSAVPLLTGYLSACGPDLRLPSPLQLHPWVTKNGEEPLPSEEEHCSVVEVTEEEVKNSVKLIPSWTTVVRGGGAEGSPVLGGPEGGVAIA